MNYYHEEEDAVAEIVGRMERADRVRHQKGKLNGRTENEPRGPRLMHSAAFVTGFTPPDYLIDGILQRRFI
jgi:hypothetical protein